MKRYLFAFVCTLLFVGNTYAQATSGTCGKNLRWSYNKQTATLTITGTGEMKLGSWSEDWPWKPYQSKIKFIKLSQGITAIGGFAFEECSSLRSVNIPNSVTYIGSHAFFNCSSLTSVTIPNRVNKIEREAFGYCTSLSSVIIPNSVTWIGEYAFFKCSSLISVTIPNSVTYIGADAFRFVPNIVYSGEASYGYGLKWWGAKCMHGYVDGFCVYNDETKTKLYGCSAQATGEIIIPNSVTVIEENAFRYCSKLTSVIIPNSVTEIKSEAFFECSSLTLVSIPNSITTIGLQAFAFCTSLNSVTIPNTVKTVDERAFYFVPNIVYSGSQRAYWCKWWGAKSMNGYVDGFFVYSDETKTNLLACSAQATGEIIIPNSVTKIDWGAFGYCTSLRSITIPNTVTEIEKDAFYSCTSLASVTIPNSVTRIGDAAFYKCPSLTSLTLSPNVQNSRQNIYRKEDNVIKQTCRP